MLMATRPKAQTMSIDELFRDGRASMPPQSVLSAVPLRRMIVSGTLV